VAQRNTEERTYAYLQVYKCEEQNRHRLDRINIQNSTAIECNFPSCSVCPVFPISGANHHIVYTPPNYTGTKLHQLTFPARYHRTAQDGNKCTLAFGCAHQYSPSISLLLSSPRHYHACAEVARGVTGRQKVGGEALPSPSWPAPWLLRGRSQKRARTG